MDINSEQKIQHLHNILDTVRETNRILVEEKDPNKLIRSVCEILVQVRGYYFSWISIIDDEKTVAYVEHAGAITGVEEIKNNILAGNLPEAHQKALKERQLVIVPTTPTDCPLKLNNKEWVTFVAPLKADDKIHGLLWAAIPLNDANHPKEKITFVDIANNIGFALGNISTQRAVEKSETRHKNFVNSLSDCLFILQNGIIEYANPKLCEISEYSEEELLGKRFNQFGLTVEINKANNGGQHDGFDPIKVLDFYESSILTKSGNPIPVEVSATPVDYDDKPATQVILRDISAYKKALKLTIESEGRFKFLSKSTFEGIIIHKNGIILDVNDSLLRISGYERQDLIGESFLDGLVHAKDKETVIKSFSDYNSSPFVVRGVKKDKSELFLEIEAKEVTYKGNLVRIAAVRDVSERYTLQKQVKASQQKLDNLMGNLPGLAYVCKNVHAWEMVFLSEGCFDLLGYHPDEIIDKNIISYDELIDSKHQKYVWETIQKSINKMESFELEYCIYDKSGQKKWVWERGKPVRVGGEILLEGFISDITERKESVDLIKKSEAKYRALFKGINDAIFVHALDPNGKDYFIEVNDIACKRYGYSYDEFMKLTPQNLEVKGASKLSILQKKQFYSEGSIVFQTLQQTKTGNLIPIEISSYIFEIDGEKMIMSLSRDITNRKKDEERIAKLLYDQTVILDNDPTFIIFKDIKNNILRITNTVVTLTGLPKHEIEGKHFSVIYPNMAEKQYEDDLEIIKKGKPKLGIIEKLTNADGSTRWLLTNKIPIKENGSDVSGIILFSTDITKLKQYENDLLEKNNQLLIEKVKAEESEYKFSAFMDYFPGSAFLKDENSTYLYVNNFMKKNFDAEKWLGKRTEEVFDEEKIHKIVYDDSRAFILGRHKYEEQYYIEGKNTRDFLTYKFTIDASNNKKLIGSISLDITERKRLEKRNSTLSKAIESSPVSVIITNSDGDIEYVNSFFEKKTGYLFEEIKGQNPRFLKSGMHSEVFYVDLWNTILSGKTWYGELHNKTKMGNLFWEKAMVSPVYNDNGKIEHIIAVKEDITEKINTLKELKIAKERAEESDRLKSAFLANMSHEIRTPMNGILGFTELLNDPNLSGEEQKEFILIIQKSGNRMLNTINDIIDISKIESGLVKVNKEEINLPWLIDELYNFFLLEANTKGIDLFVDHQQECPRNHMYSDHEKLTSILTNLLKNAIKFTKQGHVRFGYKAINNNIEFYVADTGVGIPQDRQNAIFERFVQADIADSRVFEGSGLGLAIIKHYIEMLSGSIRLESEQGKGTVFYVTIPVNERQVETMALETHSSKGKEKDRMPSNLKVLIVEDDETSANFLKIILKKVVGEFLYAENGLDAVNLVKENPDIDLVLMDLKMPVMDGLEATSLIRNFNQDVIIIAQTAFAQTDDNVKAFEVGCNDYITKPINKESLLSSIKKLLNV